MPVDLEQLRECVDEAQRFIKRAWDCLVYIPNLKINKPEEEINKVLSAAVRRSSMELTRAMEKLRKSL
jgi:hypothetical protein